MTFTSTYLQNCAITVASADHDVLAHKRRRSLWERGMGFNHWYDFGVEVVSPNPADRVTADELRAAFIRRTASLLALPDRELLQTCGLPTSTFQVQDGTPEPRQNGTATVRSG